MPSYGAGRLLGSWVPSHGSCVHSGYLNEALHNLQGRSQHILLPPQEIRHLQAVHRGHVVPGTYRDTERPVTTRNPQASCPSTHEVTLSPGGICSFLSGCPLAFRNKQHQPFWSQNYQRRQLGGQHPRKEQEQPRVQASSWLSEHQEIRACQQPITTASTLSRL